MATTTNFGWETPDDTDLVKDGAAAMRTLGNSIDTSFVDLKGGTTNQVLAKNSNTDLDFKWVADASGIPATIIDAKGDLIAGTAADTAGRLAVGTNGQYLSADSAETTGLKWVAGPSTSKTYSLVNSGGTALTGAATITVSGITGDEIMIVVVGASSASAFSSIAVRFNTDTGSKYSLAGQLISAPSTYAASFLGRNSSGPDSLTAIYLGVLSSNAGSTLGGYVRVFGCKSTALKPYLAAGSPSDGTGNGHQSYISGGTYSATAAITSISMFSDTGNFDAGTVYVYEAQ